SVLSLRYSKGSYEPSLVKVVEDVVNSLNGFRSTSPGGELQIFTRALFIHGSKSYVEFDYYAQKAKKELGDIIFIVSAVYKGRKYFEKVTINQAKKDRTKPRRPRWAIDQKQLYLLSRFPNFE